MRKELTAALLASLVFTETQAKSLTNNDEHPQLEEASAHHLKDWFDAEWFDDLIKIPL